MSSRRKKKSRPATDAERLRKAIDVANRRGERIRELQEELEAAKKENKKLRTQSFMPTGSVFATAYARFPQTNLSIHGIKQMLLSIDKQDKIQFINKRAARKLGEEDKNVLKGKPLRAADRFPFGEGLLTFLATDARQTGEEQEVIKQEIAMPSESPARRKGSAPSIRYWRVVVSPHRNGSVDFVMEDVTRLHRLEDAFQRFVAPEVVNAMVQDEEGADLSPERREITVLFCDLRGFTAASEAVSPEELSEMLSEFLGAAVDAVVEEGGMVDKFLGDGLMAIFGAPLRGKDHPLRAANSALRMVVEHRLLRRSWKERELPVPKLSVGILTGEAVVGLLGTLKRQEYTALGPWVNLCSRICDDTPGGEVHTDVATWKRIVDLVNKNPDAVKRRFRGDMVGERKYKGLARPVHVVQVYPR